MRRALVLALCAGAAGCFSDRGLALEVDVAGITATSVELYVGNAECVSGNAAGIDCRGIAPPMAPTTTTPLVTHHLRGHVWFRNDTTPYVATVHGGKATFRLEADETTTLPIVVVVGVAGAERTGVAAIYDVDVPVNTSKVETIALTVAHPISMGSTAGEERRVQTWPDKPAELADQETAGACVAVEHWSGGGVRRDFVVPPDDPDCDGFLRKPAECDPAAYDSSTPADDSTPTCFAESSDHVCRLGAPGCVDGPGETNACAPIGICAPDLFCGCTGPTADPTCPPERALAVPHINCTVGISDGEVCQAQTSVALDSHYPASDCGNPTLSALRLDDIAKGDASHTFDGAELEVTRNGGTCNLRIRAKGGTHGLVPDARGLIKLAAGNGSLVLPIVFTFASTPVCAPVLDCRLLEAPDPPDAMWSCVTQSAGRNQL